MPADVNAIMKLEVPVIVQLGTRAMELGQVTSLTPGAIIELPKAAEDELELLVNNKTIGSGVAVKVGENFGIRITYIGALEDRIRALGPTQPGAGVQTGDEEADRLAESLASGQR